MLISCLSVYTFAVDIEIDLSDLFAPSDDDSTVTPPADDNKDDEDDKDDNKNDNDNENETDIIRPVRPGKGNGTSAPVVSDDKEEEKEEETVAEWENPFTDVKESDWFFETVKYVNKNGIINGMTEDTFAPSTSLTRAMLVTVLYRVEGTPRLNSDSKFDDVDLEDWFGAAVIWASENGIVNGVSETEFAPNTAITREQIAAIMYRYAKAKGFDVSEGGMAVREFEDYETISSWATEAMQWAVNTKLINGKTETTVNPLDKATRAEAATIIMRFIEANK